jgi:1,2-diacylglycerol 3-beta-glucosyltransferase
VWRDYRGAVWRSNRLTPLEKVETTMFLLAFHLPVFQLVGTVVYSFALAGSASIAQPFGLPVLWGLLFVGPLVELGGGMLLAGVDRRKALVLMWFLPLFLVSMAVCTKAWADSMIGRRYSWVKTTRRAELAA